MDTEPIVVDDRIFLLGLDHLYREIVQQHERGELLTCAKRIARMLNVLPRSTPVEGYYGKDAELAEYFRLMRELQHVRGESRSLVDSLIEFRRLDEVTSSPIYGTPVDEGGLFRSGLDPLYYALKHEFPIWNVEHLTNVASRIASETDDFSLVGLAARAEDAVMVAALRESVVLYALNAPTASLGEPEYDWRVDEGLARAANRFIGTFNLLFGENLPTAEPTYAARFQEAAGFNEIVGRCVRIGTDVLVSPERHYHWGIYCPKYKQHAVQDFWQPDVWTTEQYRSTLRFDGKFADL